jgi:starch synthase (maltosyl-transferring)
MARATSSKSTRPASQRKCSRSCAGCGQNSNSSTSSKGEYPALQTHLNTRFFTARDDNIIWYGKPDPEGGGIICVMVNMDPHAAHDCNFEVPLWELGLPDNGSVNVEDLAEGYRFQWQGKDQWIRIAPDQPYRIWRLTPGTPA